MAEEKRSGNQNDELDQGQAASDQGTMTDAARRGARRRFLTGGLAGAPVILTLSSRPALATYCSASGMHSGNHSTVTQVTCRGRSPHYWRTHADRCSNYIVLGPTNPIEYGIGGGYSGYEDYTVPTIQELKDYRDILRENKWANRWKIREVNRYIRRLKDYPGLDCPPFGTPFAGIFANGLASDPKLTIMQSLWQHEDSPALSHCCAGYLNCHEFGREEYGYTPSEFVAMVNSRGFSDPIGLLHDLEMLNDRG